MLIFLEFQAKKPFYGCNWRSRSVSFDQFKNRTGVKNKTADREQLMDLQTEGTTVYLKASFTSIDDLRRQRIGGNLTNTSLLNRKSFKDVNREAAATVKRLDMRGAVLTERSESRLKVLQ